MAGNHFGARIMEFFSALKPPENLPGGIEILWPYGTPEVQRVMELFFYRFFDDNRSRTFLFGINPGRFGAGITGLCFTDPHRLKQRCGIAHSLGDTKELSSDFIYRMMDRLGGPEIYYRHFYLTALSPAGFLKDGKNFNYYDHPELASSLESWMVETIEEQLAAGVCEKAAFSIGQGRNFHFLEKINKKHRFFDSVRALPHPRWVMQYRRKRLNEFLEFYRQELEEAITKD